MTLHPREATFERGHEYRQQRLDLLEERHADLFAFSTHASSKAKIVQGGFDIFDDRNLAGVIPVSVRNIYVNEDVEE